MLLHKLSSYKGRLLLSVLMLKDANPDHYAVSGVECVVSHESWHVADDWHKALPGHLSHLLGVSDALVSAHCNVHSSLAYLPKTGRDRAGPAALINVFSVKTYKGRRNFGEFPFRNCLEIRNSLKLGLRKRQKGVEGVYIGRLLAPKKGTTDAFGYFPNSFSRTLSE